MDGKTGAKKWSFKTGGDVDSSPAIGPDGTVYFGSWDHSVYALKGTNGALVWKFKTGNPVFSSPAVGRDGTVYIGSWDKTFYALNGRSGAIRWTFKTKAAIESSPVIGNNGFVHIGSNDGKLYTFKSSSSGPADSAWPMFGQNARHTNRLQPRQVKSEMAIQLSSTGSIVLHYNTGTGKWLIQSSSDLSNWQHHKAVSGSGSETIPVKASSKPAFFRLISAD